MTPFYARVRVTWRPRDPVFSVNFQVASGRAARMGDASLKSCEILKAVKAAHLYSSLFGENAVKRDGGAAKRERGPARDQIYQFGSVEALSTICTFLTFWNTTSGESEPSGHGPPPKRPFQSGEIPHEILSSPGPTRIQAPPRAD
eukprot:2307712-Rhodomonas_salina.2